MHSILEILWFRVVVESSFSDVRFLQVQMTFRVRNCVIRRELRRSECEKIIPTSTSLLTKAYLRLTGVLISFRFKSLRIVETDLVSFSYPALQIPAPQFVLRDANLSYYMSQIRIAVVGAGIAGLVLGRCLLRRGIPIVLYERDSFLQASKRYNYGITLEASTYRPLLKILDLDERVFRQKIAVDGAVGGLGRLESESSGKEASFRANRNKLESLLRENLDVRWEHDISDVRFESAGSKVHFKNGHAVETTLLVGADGPHSRVRKIISPATEFEILPYVVFNGKRRLTPSAFRERYAARMSDANVIEHWTANTLLQISTNEKNDQQVSISYTYSRPAHQHNDPLFRPSRPKSGATDTPAELFTEIANLANLPGPFKDVFNPGEMKKDRLLNWLMRCILVPGCDLLSACEGGPVLIGDACHHGPILGSPGANEAIVDAMELAELIAENDRPDLQQFYQKRYDAWTKYLETSRERLAETHERPRSNL